jgi:D-alanyl-D-alanine carboxypeptidase
VLGSEDTYSRFTDTSSLLDWVNSEEFIKVMDTNEEIPINVNGNSEVLHPLYSITTSDEFFLNGFIKDVTYNEIFFDEDGDLKKTVPVGEIVATMNIQKIDSTSASNIFSEGEILSIPLVSENEIKKEKLVVKKAKDIKMFFEEYLNK